MMNGGIIGLANGGRIGFNSGSKGTVGMSQNRVTQLLNLREEAVNKDDRDKIIEIDQELFMMGFRTPKFILSNGFPSKFLKDTTRDISSRRSISPIMSGLQLGILTS